MEFENTLPSLAANREKVIVRTSLIGIGANLLLAGFKAIIGVLTHSIAVTLDAVNNLSDALSSVVTILGAKLGAKLPDKKHPLGYGRVEYLSAMLVAAIVLYAGITSAVESVKKIFAPEVADYSPISLIIIAAAIVVKLLLGRFVKAQGKKVGSGALEASGADALFDAILSLSVLLSAVVYLVFHISLEAYVGVVISGFIIKSGVEMMMDTLNDILGQRADADLTREIKQIIMSEPEVRGAYDLIINNYGPDKNYASVHVELPDVMTVEEADMLTRRIEAKVYKKTGVILTAIGLYSFNTKDDEAAMIQNRVTNLVMSHEWALQMHGFYADTAKKALRFDVVLSFDVVPRTAIEELCTEITAIYPDYQLQITPDVDITD